MPTIKKIVESKPKEEKPVFDPKIKFAGRKIGANFSVVYGGENGERFAKKVSMEEGEVIKQKIELFNKRPSEKAYKVIVELMTSEATKIKQEKEKAETKVKGLKKLVNKEEKSEVKEVAKVKSNTKQAVVISTSEGRELLDYTKKGIVMKGFENITMPALLVSKLAEFLKANISIKPLLNFWSLCLLNPNEIARTRLFEYLSRHKFIITPSGYFVTYRMVKKTNNKDVFTDAHTGTMKYKIGEVQSIPRSECDEDGSRDCSKGLHVGSPDFIGITKGDGYNKQTGQVGTGYVNQTSSGFGDQPIICFVNPRHVVSIPNSETRKLRCCEFYPFKLTTPEEIIAVDDSDYFIYENDYKKLELKELMDSINKEDLKEYLSGNAQYNQDKINKLNEKIKAAQLSLGGDTVAKSLDLEEIKSIVNSRITTLEVKYPEAVQL